MLNRRSSFVSAAAFLSLMMSCVIATIAIQNLNAQEGSEEKMLRHVVMFKFKKDTSDADIKKVVDAFRELPKKIDAIADFEYGTNNSPEGLNDGFEHCFLVTFESEEARGKYLPHPAHKAFVDVLKPHLEKALVIDYWAAK